MNTTTVLGIIGVFCMLVSYLPGGGWRMLRMSPGQIYQEFRTGGIRRANWQTALAVVGVSLIFLAQLRSCSGQ